MSDKQPSPSRAPNIGTSRTLSDRIAALNTNPSSSSSSSAGNRSSIPGPGALKNLRSRFEGVDDAPLIPKGSFGLGAPSAIGGRSGADRNRIAAGSAGTGLGLGTGLGGRTPAGIAAVTAAGGAMASADSTRRVVSSGSSRSSSKTRETTPDSSTVPSPISSSSTTQTTPPHPPANNFMATLPRSTSASLLAENDAMPAGLKTPGGASISSVQVETGSNSSERAREEDEVDMVPTTTAAADEESRDGATTPTVEDVTQEVRPPDDMQKAEITAKHINEYEREVDDPTKQPEEVVVAAQQDTTLSEPTVEVEPPSQDTPLAVDTLLPAPPTTEGSEEAVVSPASLAHGLVPDTARSESGTIPLPIPGAIPNGEPKTTADRPLTIDVSAHGPATVAAAAEIHKDDNVDGHAQAQYASAGNFDDEHADHSPPSPLPGAYPRDSNRSGSLRSFPSASPSSSTFRVPPSARGALVQEPEVDITEGLHDLNPGGEGDAPYEMDDILDALTDRDAEGEAEDPDAAPKVKCSDCSKMIGFDELESHTCDVPTASTTQTQTTTTRPPPLKPANPDVPSDPLSSPAPVIGGTSHSKSSSIDRFVPQTVSAFPEDVESPTYNQFPREESTAAAVSLPKDVPSDEHQEPALPESTTSAIPPQVRQAVSSPVSSRPGSLNSSPSRRRPASGVPYGIDDDDEEYEGGGWATVVRTTSTRR